MNSEIVLQQNQPTTNQLKKGEVSSLHHLEDPTWAVLGWRTSSDSFGSQGWAEPVLQVLKTHISGSAMPPSLFHTSLIMFVLVK